MTALTRSAPLQVERQNKPEVEFNLHPELMLPPVRAPRPGLAAWLTRAQVRIARNENEHVLVEASLNSCRISIKVKQADELEEILARKLLRFLMQRADEFRVLRRVPVAGYDISFLITHVHVEEMLKAKLVDFVVVFMEEIDREVSELKLAVSSRGRVVATDFLKCFSA